MKKGKLAAVLCVVSLVGTIAASGALISPNYGKSVEQGILFYDGYVQCQPSFNDGGRHAARGYFTYQNGASGTQTWRTERGSGMSDTNIYSVSGRYMDSLNPVAPKTTFTYGFTWVPHGSQMWPVSAVVTD